MPMRRRRSQLTSVAILALTLALACAVAANSDTVRIGLTRFKDVKQITVLASSDYSVGAVLFTNLEPVTITAGGKAMTLKRPDGATVETAASVSVVPKDSAGTINVDSPGKPGKQYRGTLEVSVKSGRLRLVNDVRVEDYLVGVLAAEMPSSYPVEALKAQAVAARTYTVRCRGKHASSGYDLCDGSHCQVYDGTLRETPSHRRAALATKGQVLTYNGQPASTMYSADCGGVTERCGENAPYLASVAEPAEITHSTWTRTYTLADLSARLVAAGFKQADGLQKVTISKTSSSGRALTVTFVGAKAAVAIDGAKLRFVLGPDVIRSTLFTVETGPDGTITFDGRGCGHGIGMCQVGAKALASPPFNYTSDQILAHYYPGTKLSGAPDSAQPAKTAVKGQDTPLRVRVVEPKL